MYKRSRCLTGVLQARILWTLLSETPIAYAGGWLAGRTKELTGFCSANRACGSRVAIQQYGVVRNQSQLELNISIPLHIHIHPFR